MTTRDYAIAVFSAVTLTFVVLVFLTMALGHGQ